MSISKFQIRILISMIFVFSFFPIHNTLAEDKGLIDSAVDLISGQTVIDQNAEIRKNLISPSLQVNIPGIEFTQPDKIVVSQEPGSDKTYIGIPFLAEYIEGIYNYIIPIAGLLAIIVIMFSGLQWIISGGNASKIKEAQKRITDAILGLTLAILSYTLLYTLNPNLVLFENIDLLYIRGIPLETYDKGILTTLGSPNNLTYTASNFDPLFISYQPCLEIDWKILKAVAYQESSLNPMAESDTGYKGLFQTTETNCRDAYLKPYDLSTMCNDIYNPEVSTMVGVSSMIMAKKIVEATCPNASFESKIFFMYTAHHSGNGGSRAIMKSIKKVDPTCNWQNAEEHIYQMWLKETKKTVAEDDIKCNAGKYCAKRHAHDGMVGGTNVVKAALSYGSQLNYINNNMSMCPLKTQTLIGQTKL